MLVRTKRLLIAYRTFAIDTLRHKELTEHYVRLYGTGNGTTYRYFDGKPDVAFGFGLSAHPPIPAVDDFSQLLTGQLVAA